MKNLAKDKYQGNPKYKAVRTDHVSGYSKGVSDFDKLTSKNANRAVKKSARQQAKLEIRAIINHFI